MQSNYDEIIDKKVRVIVDRPLGSAHPKYQSLIYPLNYGYIEGVITGDGECQDCYILGENEPIKAFNGVVIAIIHRLNDVEDKWVVAREGVLFSEQEILDAVAFQEQYFNIKLIR
ncbi:MAG: inorganic pyrophosphatase [Clostridia bacterium]|nr:inorganic pyrophosphatase [Clostridia bacterium]MBQ8447223.1 inorganic pyrophosphatase [Clostridia bacterium]